MTNMSLATPSGERLETREEDAQASSASASSHSVVHDVGTVTVPAGRTWSAWPFVVGLIVASAFGPYIVGPMRTEQILVYALAPLALFGVVRAMRHARVLSVVLLWLGLFLSSALGAIFPAEALRALTPGGWIATLDNLMLPLVIMFLVWGAIPAHLYRRVFVVAAKTLVVFCVANALLAAATSANPGLAGSLGMFWTGSGGSVDGVSVGDNSMIMGRYSGVFGQPAEAGVAYSLAIIVSVWLYRRRPFVLYPVLGLISLGGILSVSKVFLFIGAPLAVVLAWIMLRGWHRMGLVLGLFALVVVAFQSGVFEEWDGLDYFLRLYDGSSEESASELYTANRWDEESPMLQNFSLILANAPLFGAGLRSLDVPLDSQWTETIVISGVAGSLCVFLLLVTLQRLLRDIYDRDFRLLAMFVWFALVASTMGLPLLTANRVSALVWVLFALFVGIAASDREITGGRKATRRGKASS